MVSYNVLSLHSGNDGTYLNLDRSPKALDVQHRRKLINEKISTWMQHCKVICLQEATASLILKEFNPALAALQEEHEYECHSHFYQFQQNRTDPSQMGTNILGLAILFPQKIFRAVHSALLFPWNIADRSNMDRDAIVSLEREYLDIQNLVSSLGKNRSDPVLLQQALSHLMADVEPKANVMLPALNKLAAELSSQIDQILAQYKKKVPPYADRGILVVTLENSTCRRLVLATVHLPCQFRNPKTITSIAINTKQTLLQWLEENRLLRLPVLLCGDFNAGPLNSAFTGTLEHSSEHVDASYISASDIETYVSNEPWTDLLEGGCTLYGFTRNTYNDAVKELKALMDSLAPHLSQLAVLCSKDSSDLEDVLQT